MRGTGARLISGSNIVFVGNEADAPEGDFAFFDEVALMNALGDGGVVDVRDGAIFINGFSEEVRHLISITPH